MTVARQVLVNQGKSELPALAWMQDGLALVYLGRILVPFIGLALAGYRLSGLLLPAWLMLAYWSDQDRQLWKSITRSSGIFIGLCGYSIWLIFEWLIGRSLDAGVALSSLITIIPIYTMGCFYGYQHPTRFWRINRILLAILGVQAAFSLPHLIADTGLPKNVMHAVTTYGLTGGASFMMGAARRGIGGYDLYMNTSIIVAVTGGFALATRSGLLTRSFWMFAWASLVLANIVSTFTASALVAVLGSVAVLLCAIVMRKFALSNALILIVMIALVGVLVLDKVRSSAAYEYVFNKSSSVFEAVREGGLRAEPTTRGELLFVSWDAWLESPIIGHGSQGSFAAASGTSIGGGHSTWLHILVQYGLVGGFWFYLMVFSVGRQILQAVKMRPGDLLAKAFMIAYVSYLLFGIINTVMMDVVFFFLLYGGALALQSQSHADEWRVQSLARPSFMSTRGCAKQLCRASLACVSQSSHSLGGSARDFPR